MTSSEIDSRDSELPPRIQKLDIALIIVLGLLVQLVWLLVLNEPKYMDAFYYSISGRELAAGNGFNTMVIWQYLDNPAGLPAPSHTYWMPLPSILAAAGYKLSDTFTGAQLPFWLLAGLLPSLGSGIVHSGRRILRILLYPADYFRSLRLVRGALPPGARHGLRR
jgi:hypothetical protein